MVEDSASAQASAKAELLHLVKQTISDGEMIYRELCNAPENTIQYNGGGMLMDALIKTDMNMDKIIIRLSLDESSASKYIASDINAQTDLIECFNRVKSNIDLMRNTVKTSQSCCMSPTEQPYYGDKKVRLICEKITQKMDMANANFKNILNIKGFQTDGGQTNNIPNNIPNNISNNDIANNNNNVNPVNPVNPVKPNPISTFNGEQQPLVQQQARTDVYGTASK